MGNHVCGIALVQVEMSGLCLSKSELCLIWVFKDYESFVTTKLGKELYTVKFSWEEFDAFKPYIDKAYRKYKKIISEENE